MSAIIPKKIYVIFLLLFLGGLNFAGNAVLFMYMAAFCCILLGGFSAKIDKIFFYILLLFFSIVCSALLNNTEGMTFLIIKYALYPILFIAFYDLFRWQSHIGMCENDKAYIFFLLMFFFSAGNIVHMIIDMTASDMSMLGGGRRIINDVWSGGTAPTTIIVGWGVLAGAVFLHTWDGWRDKIPTFVVSLFFLIVYIVFSFMAATRLGIVNVLLLIFAFIVMKLRSSELVVKSSTIIKIFIGVLLICILTYKLIPLILESNLYTRMTDESISLLDSNGRLDATIFLIQHFSKSLWGGDYFTAQYGLQQHNVLLQMYDTFGILAFLLMLIIVISSIKLTVNYFRSSSIVHSNERRFVMLLYIGLMLYYFEEPALTSNFIITCSFFGYLGFVSQTNASIRAELIEGN
jgi:hypothetical protein